MNIGLVVAGVSGLVAGASVTLARHGTSDLAVAPMAVGGGAGVMQGAIMFGESIPGSAPRWGQLAAPALGIALGGVALLAGAALTELAISE